LDGLEVVALGVVVRRAGGGSVLDDHVTLIRCGAQATTDSGGDARGWTARDGAPGRTKEQQY
jgi:hypothetical protein